MKQLKMTALAIALSTAAASSAMAQSTKTNAWEGADVAISAGYGQFMPKIGGGTTSSLLPYSSYGNVNATANNVNTATANLSVGYNWGINTDYVIGIRAIYYPGASSSATGSMVVTSSGVGGVAPAGTVLQTANVQYNVKNLYSIVLTPGYVIDQSSLVYAKVGYTGATIGLNGPTLAYSSLNLTGYTLGVGYKQMITNSIYALGEFNYSGYSNKTATVTNTSGVNITAPFGGSGIDFLVGLGYRF
jgi:opacity protein-like surface antigen